MVHHSMRQTFRTPKVEIKSSRLDQQAWRFFGYRRRAGGDRRGALQLVHRGSVEAVGHVDVHAEDGVGARDEHTRVRLHRHEDVFGSVNLSRSKTQPIGIQLSS